MRFCVIPNCNQPVFGTDKNTNEGYCNRHQHFRTDTDKRSILSKAIAKHKENLKNNPNPREQKIKQLPPKEKRKLRSGIESKVRGLGNSTANIETVNKQMSKSELMKEADRLFSLFIRNRDSDKEGWVVCPLCNKRYNLEQETYAGDKIINCLHFLDRDIYSFRYNPDFSVAGCCYCNKHQHDFPKGQAYQAFRKILIEKLGETEVALAELVHRKINKIEAQQLRNIIEYYNNPL